jgi:hypothetical protein
MTDRELLEAAAKAAGIDWADGHESTGLRDQNGKVWNPLTDDGDALRLAVKLNLLPRQGVNLVSVLRPDAGWNDENYSDHAGDKFAATRRAIVRAAAEIGRSMK